MLTVRFSAALLVAAELHATQRRKGSDTPYLSHLLTVAGMVLENGADEDTAIAALLHDAIEDRGDRFAGGSDALRAYLTDRFGTEVVAIVEACTDADTFPKPPWTERKQQYISQIGHKSPEALLVSCADKLHNARAILRDYLQLGDALWERFNGGKEGTLWYYRALVVAFRQTPAAPEMLVTELDEVVTELEQLVSPS